MSLGTGSVCSKSVKQRLNTRSSTEAELVATSEQAGRPIHTRNYLLSQGYELGPARLHQDNQSTIILISSGIPGSDRTRHINIRQFWVKDKIDQGEIELVFCPTHQMLADGLSKPLVGQPLKDSEIALGAWDNSGK
jgi:hypothetical protein